MLQTKSKQQRINFFLSINFDFFIHNLHVVDTIRWPLKYLQLFDRQPLRTFQSIVKIAISFDQVPVHAIHIHHEVVFD